MGEKENTQTFSQTIYSTLETCKSTIYIFCTAIGYETRLNL